jgi:hypothetical protein
VLDASYLMFQPPTTTLVVPLSLRPGSSGPSGSSGDRPADPAALGVGGGSGAPLDIDPEAGVGPAGAVDDDMYVDDGLGPEYLHYPRLKVPGGSLVINLGSNSIDAHCNCPRHRDKKKPCRLNKSILPDMRCKKK